MLNKRHFIMWQEIGLKLHPSIWTGGLLFLVSATMGNKKMLVKPWTCCIFSEDWLYLKNKPDFQLPFLFSSLDSEKDVTVVSGAVCWTRGAIAESLHLWLTQFWYISLPLVTEDYSLLCRFYCFVLKAFFIVCSIWSFCYQSHSLE